MINRHSKKTVFFLFFVLFIFCASQASAFRLTPRMKNKKTRTVQTKQVRTPRPAPTKRSQSSLVNPEESKVRMPKYSQSQIVEDDYIDDDDGFEDETPKYSRKVSRKKRLASYVSGGGGAVFYEGQKLWGVEIENTTGPLLTVAFGQRFENLRAEAEVQYQRVNTTVRAKIDGKEEQGTITASNLSILSNLYFDFFPQKTVSPFLTVGGGYGSASTRLDSKIATASGSVGAWVFTFGAGLSLQMRDDLTLDLRYRKSSFTAYQYGVSTTEYCNAITLGLRYAF